MSTTVFITGANGEIGHGLIQYLSDQDDVRIVALDLHPIDKTIAKRCSETVVGDILDPSVLQRLSSGHEFAAIYHLAALLSTRSEKEPLLAHRVNVDGMLNILELANTQSKLQGRSVTVLYPSSIAVYGMPSLNAKELAGSVREPDWCQPRTMYGINKLYCEHLGGYYSDHYRQLDMAPAGPRVDVRCIRFPGLISAHTLPTGGTSDFGPEMLHAAAQKKPYACFVRADARIPFMAMPDAVRALLKLAAAPSSRLTQRSYNIGAFNPSAGEFADLVRDAFPGAEITFEPDVRRQAIVDSWPADVDASAAAHDWDFKPAYSLKRAFEEYLVPAVRERYRA
jgi:nucleoside-diphosphate-sugar epimerase